MVSALLLHFIVENESVVKIYDSLFSLNFAVSSGVIEATNNGYFEFYNTTIRNNYAVSSSVGLLFDVAGVSKVQSSTIEENMVLASSDVLKEVTVLCNYL